MTFSILSQGSERERKETNACVAIMTDTVRSCDLKFRKYTI